MIDYFEDKVQDYIIYCTKNIVNGKIYIGVHKRRKRGVPYFDGYFGTNIRLERALKKYGKENFIRETLRECDSMWEVHRLERLTVNKNFIAREDTYNFKEGGKGGWIYQEHLPEEHKRKISKGSAGHKKSADFIEKISEISKKRWEGKTFETYFKNPEEIRIKQSKNISRRNIRKILVTPLSGHGFSFLHGIMELSKDVEMSVYFIRQILKGKLESYKNYRFSDIDKIKSISEERKKRISESNKGKICNSETRKKMSIWQKNKPKSETKITYKNNFTTDGSEI